MRKTLLTALLASALPVFALAKENPTIPSGPKSLHFLENNGQIKNQDNKERTDIQFSVASGNMNVFIGDGQIHYQFTKINNPKEKLNTGGINTLNKKEKSTADIYRLDVTLLGANKNASVVKEEKQEFVTNFVKFSRTSHDQRKVKATSTIEAYSYDKITYKNVYPNIDWVVYSKGDELEYDFVIRPGGKVSDIKIKYTGATKLSINNDGSLTATTPMGTVNEKAPYSFQTGGQNIASSFVLNGDVLSFSAAPYTGTLTIDPSLTWGTYYGSTGTEEYSTVTSDGTSLYAGGYTTSNTNISTDGSTYMGGTTNGYDGFLSSFTMGGALNWTTYWSNDALLGGDDNIASVSASGGVVYIAGSSDDLGDFDAYLVQFTTTGIFSGGLYWGDVGDDFGNIVTSDAVGNAYFGGSTQSTTNISITGAYQMNISGVVDGFIAKTDITGNPLWSTYYGGLNNDVVNGLAVDLTGNLYVAGSTTSTNAMATLTQTVYGGGAADLYLAQFNGVTGLRNWATYAGGTSTDDFARVAIAPIGGVGIYLIGSTSSTNAIATAGTAQFTYGGGVQDGCLIKYSAAGAKLWGTYYGGSGDDAANYVATDPVTASVYVAGGTLSTNILNANGYQTTSGGGLDACMAKFDNTNGKLVWGTYYGGTGGDRANGIVADNQNNFYVCGVTDGINGISTPLSEQPASNGGWEGFLSRFCDHPVSSDTIVGPNSICAGATQTYSIPAMNGATSYTWTLPGGWTGTSTTNSISVTIGSTTGNITVKGNNLCGSSAVISKLVTVNPIPTATITPAGPTTFCTGGSVVLNASTGTGYSWAWFQGATPVGTNSSSYTANATGNYTVQITANGCSATSSAVSVTVNPTPATPTATNNGAVCTGQALNFTGNCTTPGVTYNWTGPNNFPATQNPTIASAQASDAGTYTLTVTVNGCSATATTTAVVTNSAPATPSAINGDISICENSTANIYNVTPDPNAASYTWTLPVGWTGSSTTSSINTTAGGPGSGTISVTATNGCGTSSAQTLNVTINANPTPVITQSGNTLTVTGTYTSYQWYNGAGLISGATAQSYNAPASGSYYCIVTDANGCTGTSNTLTVTVGVNNVNKVSSVNLYPNPNTGSFSIEGAFASNDGKANIAIVDVAGRTVQTQDVSVNNNKLSVRIDMTSSLAAGVYTIKVSSDAANAVIPFVKN